ncbi:MULTISPECIES: hypothetical protein [unclassified Pseudomonas]|uniref:hypothetical protein n=1 Tax=unclassified Pseudomonas TaxID=196821 RepID=UPI00244B8B82|nr:MULTISPECIES: hypothetical protein [unclassified Pseudomonas]MDG9928771.1 hypothetical protein [Pseudomonas sp. GD04042]MDH0481840.1 hypothetical protein [Pseudomonas sp. GD04015]MDH0603212.1 hypothetical protein [Pseudomonas sp. GD03869]
MIFHMVALSLPVDGYYFTLHKHLTAAGCSWTEADREAYPKMLEHIESLYTTGPAAARFRRDDLEALYDPNLTPQEALRKVLPHYITCTSANKKRITFPHRDRNCVEVLGPAGRPDEPFGLRLAVIAKGCGKLDLMPWVLEEAGRQRGTPFTEDEIQTLEGRSDRTLVEVISKAQEPITAEGFAKIVAVPAEASVRLTRTHRGEFISEVPRVWS